MAPALPGLPPPPGPGLEINIENFPDSIVIPVCDTSTIIEFTVRITDYCSVLSNLNGLFFNGIMGSQVINSAYSTSTGFIAYLEAEVSLEDNGESWYIGIEDSSGNIIEDSVMLQVVGDIQDNPPIISMPNMLQFIIPDCKDSIYKALDFYIFDDCTPIDLDVLNFDNGGINPTYEPFFIQNTPNEIQINFAAYFTVGTYEMHLSYQNITESLTINVTQEMETETQIILPSNLIGNLAGCEDEVYTTFSIIIDPWCDYVFDPFNPQFYIISANWDYRAIGPILEVSGYFEFYESLSIRDHGAHLMARYRTSTGIMIEESALIFVDYCEPCPPIVECAAFPNYTFGGTTCKKDTPVRSPDILSNVDTVVILTELFIDIEQEVVDDSGELTGEFITIDSFIGSLDPMELDVNAIPLQLGTFDDLSPGLYKLRYIVSNANEDTTITDCSFQVSDQRPPDAICNDHLSVIVNGDETVRYYVSNIDDGSFDNCGLIKLEIRRSYPVSANACDSSPVVFSDWSNYIEFTNCDLGQLVRIELRVWDDRNVDGIPGNTIAFDYNGNIAMIADNYSICSIEEEVYTLLRPDSLVSLVEPDSDLDQLAPTSTFQLLQNAPNPFSKSTLIGFQISKETKASLKVRDLNGRILYSQKTQFDRGYHEVSINKADLQASGLLFYTLETADFTATRKMVVLE